MLGVILDARYFIPLHCSSVSTGTSTCCKMPGSDPPSDVLPHPTTVPIFPDGSIDSFGKQIGWMLFVKVTDFRNLSKAMSWLYVFWSKFLCRIIALTALCIASVSVVTNWSWSPKITRILHGTKIFNTLTCYVHIEVYKLFLWISHLAAFQSSDTVSCLINKRFVTNFIIRFFN